jgi:HD-GYP domain-containing protein (c-di-GMP phosphodiesterase class II)
MSIESMRDYLLHDLPAAMGGLFDDVSSALGNISPLLYLALIAALMGVCTMAVRSKMRHARREKDREAFFLELSRSASEPEMLEAMAKLFRILEPAVKSVGIYMREPSRGFRLVLMQDYAKEAAGDEPALEQLIAVGKAHEKQGRYHVYTFSSDERACAVRLTAYHTIDAERLRPEYHALAILAENIIKNRDLKTDLLRTRLLHESKSLFLSPLFDRDGYFRFIGRVMVKANDLDAVRVILKDGEILVGERSLASQQGKALSVRNTDVRVVIYKRRGITDQDVASVGRVLDMISATMTVYSSEAHTANYLHFLETAVSIMEEADPYYASHSAKVEGVAVALGETVGLGRVQLQNLRYAARFHDVGMLGDIYDLASKNIAFTEKEYGRVKYHSLIGAAVAVPLDLVHPISTIIMQHHELLDGTGYPNGVGPKDMPVESRILALSEMFVGLVSDRPHRKGCTAAEAIDRIGALTPSKVDRAVFDALVSQKNRILQGL